MPPVPIPDTSALTPRVIIDILLVAFLIYQFAMMLRGRRAAHVMIGICVLVGVYIIAVWAGLELLRTALAAMVPYTAFALIVVFQSEIRRLLARIGRRQMIGIRARYLRSEVIEDILLALQHMSEQKTGALIVVEREIGLRTFIESGVHMDAVVSRDLLLSIFHPKGALHDGAVIIQGDRIAAAACFLPLSMNPAVMRQVGTRHRAAIGATEESDAIALVVSEESGRMSIAAHGELEADVTLTRIGEVLSGRSGFERRPAAVAAPEWKQARP